MSKKELRHTRVSVNQYMRLMKMQGKLSVNGSIGHVIINDNLEDGALYIYESDMPVTFQEVYGQCEDSKSVTVIAEVIVSEVVKSGKKVLFLHKLEVKSGYDGLEKELWERVIEFALYYNYKWIAVNGMEKTESEMKNDGFQSMGYGNLYAFSIGDEFETWEVK